ncbi:hypothetical protein SIM91_44100 [Rhodococcus opacus]|uniref:hypothetical protein n=1 Tax=Rhodococcus opacus TaxID=37919 RepID=UPI0007CD7D33|nr:hypothetical protein [Rhodococcus opacus]MDX5970129.1 hypothetical protein [Rhodococcus opacus]NKY75199.1 hypothetical protein [Rhodococcus opacus]CAG7633443.1 hypothetical protein E143388_07502 [Rhodococcus opacus]
MTLANRVTEVNATVIPERPERETVWPWHELDYAQLEADSDRILADALTPQAVVLLTRLATAPADPPRPSPPASMPGTVSTPPAPEIRATQRSPPKPGKSIRKSMFRM